MSQRGFTLLELMIVVLIVAVLAGLAFNAYNNQVRKSRRAEAKQVLSDLMLKQEKYRSNNTTFGTVAQVGGAASSTYYDFCPVAATCTQSATAYVLTAVPKGDQTKDSCGTLTLSMSAGTVTKSPTTGCW